MDPHGGTSRLCWVLSACGRSSRLRWVWVLVLALGSHAGSSCLRWVLMLGPRASQRPPKASSVQEKNPLKNAESEGR
ncbi:hypothetical protein NL676_014338 [Syzygium grande]|nr:hypothetical protein NL676_014338 [Syzygium grande]